MEKHLIHSDPSIMMGKPVIKGTRITVELILDKLAAGETFEQVLDAHPRLTKESLKETTREILLNIKERALNNVCIHVP
ncbi:MAG: DUF433 domain-containing protein [bacterium]|nr:DUF433 domain-containing protein [bacterium]